jgi:hypothetical protein
MRCDAAASSRPTAARCSWTRLLRVLAEGEFYRVGGQTPIKVDVRVIAATHQNLEDRVASSLFREDLFHRLNVIRIELPPLRLRGEDVPALLNHYMQIAAKELGVEAKTLAEDAAEALRLAAKSMWTTCRPRSHPPGPRRSPLTTGSTAFLPGRTVPRPATAGRCWMKRCHDSRAP